MAPSRRRRQRVIPSPPSVYGAFEVLEGPAIEGAVILQFPSMQDAKDWYNSDTYQDALRHRLAGAKYRVFFIDGIN